MAPLGCQSLGPASTSGHLHLFSFCMEPSSNRSMWLSLAQKVPGSNDFPLDASPAFSHLLQTPYIILFSSEHVSVPPSWMCGPVCGLSSPLNISSVRHGLALSLQGVTRDAPEPTQGACPWRCPTLGAGCSRAGRGPALCGSTHLTPVPLPGSCPRGHALSLEP